MVFENGVKNIQATAYNGARTVYVKEIKIATGDDVLLNSWFCLVNWHLGKFGPHPWGG